MRMLLIDSHIVFSSIFRSLAADSADITPGEFYESCLRSIKKVIASKRPTHALFCIDDYSRSWRREVMPGYRQERFRLPLHFIAKMPGFISRLKKEIGVPSISCSNSESYDVIATIVNKLSRLDSIMVDILATDSRAYALLTNSVTMFCPYGNEANLVKDGAWLQEKYGFSGSRWLDFISLVGDAHKGILGIPGIGKKRAYELITEYGSLENVSAEKSAIDGALGVVVRENIAFVLDVVRPIMALKKNLHLSVNLKDCRLPVIA